MLVLSRSENERIVLPDCGVTVSVVGISGNRVKLGFDAPRSVRILRDELPRTADPRAAQVVDRQRLGERLSSIEKSLRLVSRIGVFDPQESDQAIAKALWEIGAIRSELDVPLESQPAASPSVEQIAGTTPACPVS